MKLTKIIMISSALLIGAAGSAMAQTTKHHAHRHSVAPMATQGDAQINGMDSSAPLGAGGTAGTYPTGANVGPGRAEMVRGTSE